MTPEETLRTMSPAAQTGLLEFAAGRDYAELNGAVKGVLANRGVIRLDNAGKFELSPHGRRVLALIRMRKGM